MLARSFLTRDPVSQHSLSGKTWWLPSFSSFHLFQLKPNHPSFSPRSLHHIISSLSSQLNLNLSAHLSIYPSDCKSLQDKSTKETACIQPTKLATEKRLNLENKLSSFSFYFQRLLSLTFSSFFHFLGILSFTFQIRNSQDKSSQVSTSCGIKLVVGMDSLPLRVSLPPWEKCSSKQILFKNLR